MGLMDWFRKLAGEEPGAAGVPASAAEDAAALDEICGLDFRKAIEAHLHWKSLLQAHIQGTGSTQLEMDAVACDGNCALGRWIHGEGGAAYGDLRIFRELSEAHVEFHRRAGEVFVAAQTGPKEEALRLLDRSDYVDASDRVKTLLAKLYLGICRSRRPS